MNKYDRRKGWKDEDGADFISNLPDPILVLILSGLPSTEEVIRSSVLSRRWRYVWTSIPSLDLEYPREGKRSEKSRKSKFKEFVYWVLLNRSVNLDRFCLSCGDHYSLSTVERWIHATVMRNVKQLDLRFGSKEESEDMALPHCLVTCASLEVLSLNVINHRLILPSFSGFRALRVLNLTYLKLSDDGLLNNFVESCPMLEDLTLNGCTVENHDRVCISCLKLKKLRIIHGLPEGYLKICCPKLLFLELSDEYPSDVIVERPYSLKEAIINFIEYENIHGVFPGISQVEFLDTDLYFLCECMDAACDPALPNLKSLVLTTTSKHFTFKNLVQILKHCPELEYLTVSVENLFSYDSEEFDGPEYEKLDEAERRRMMIPYLKWVESFEINGEKPKLDIIWGYVDATWGKKAMYSQSH